MSVKFKTAVAVAAVLVVIGVGVELTGERLQADSTVSPAADYAASRVESALQAVANMPQVEPVGVPLATKGDLPVPLGCLGLQVDAEAECMDVAYEVPSHPSIVVETRFGNTSTLMRMDAATVANVANAEPPIHSE